MASTHVVAPRQLWTVAFSEYDGTTLLTHNTVYQPVADRDLSR